MTQDNNSDTQIPINNDDEPLTDRTDQTVAQKRSKVAPRTTASTVNTRANSKRSIRDITRDTDPEKRAEKKPAFADERRFSSRRYKSSGKSSWLYAVGGLLVAIILFIIFGSVAHRATLALETTQYTLATSDSIELVRGNDYEVKTFTVSAERLVESSGSEEVEDFAEGLLTVLNTSDEPQRLIATTRFETADGVVYRVPSAITIPAANGSEPGKLTDVRVVADKPGVESNQTVSDDLIVPGLIGTDLEGVISGTAQTEFSGGFTGTRAVASADDLNSAEEELMQELESNLDQLVIADLGVADVLIDLVASPEFNLREEPAEGSDSSVKVVLRATVEGVVMNRSQLVSVMAANNEGSRVPGEIQNLEILNPDDLDFSIEDQTDESMTLLVNSPVMVGYSLDPQAIEEALVGLSVGEVEEVLTAESGISDYDLQISPFWKNSLPNNPDRITVEIASNNEGRQPVAENEQPTDDSEQLDEETDEELDVEASSRTTILDDTDEVETEEEE